MPYLPEPPPRTARIVEPDGDVGVIVQVSYWLRDLNKPSGYWCIYGDPCSPATLRDHAGCLVLWGTCRHPVDLTDGAAARHEFAYRERAARWDPW